MLQVVPQALLAERIMSWGKGQDRGKQNPIMKEAWEKSGYKLG
jgi:hypothetical protein